MLKIHISSLQEGEHFYEFKFSQDEFKFFEIEDLEIVNDLIIETRLNKYGNQFDLKTILKGSFKLNCDRCLDDYIFDFDNSFEVIYKFDFSNEKDSFENDIDEIKLINPKTSRIDLKEDVRDFLLLSVPMKKVPEEENDICSYCKKNIPEILNISRSEEINPVWEKLIKTKK